MIQNSYNISGFSLKSYVLVFLLLFFGVAGTMVYAVETCVTQEPNINSEDMDYFYLGGRTEQGTSMIDLLLVNKESGLNEKKEQVTSQQRRGLIHHFCDVALRTNDDENMMRSCMDADGFRYDPRQSLFMYALCVNMDDKGGNRKIGGITFPKRNLRKVFDGISYLESEEPFGLKPYINDDIDADLNAIWGIPLQEDLDNNVVVDSCNPKTSMQGCDMTTILPHIFNTIMNDYSNMKLASIYGYKYLRSTDSPEKQKEAREKAIADFARSYFGIPGRSKKDSNNECNAKGLNYITGLEGAVKNLKSNQKHCRHPKVYNILDETIKSVQGLLEKVVIVKAEDVLAVPCKDAKNNIMSCAFSSSGKLFIENDRIAFQNLYMNELMRYTLFTNYYGGQISSNPAYNKMSVSNYSDALLDNQKESRQLLKEIVIAKKSMTQTIHYLQNLYTTFPLHIALMAYLEDVTSYRSVLAKIYTPLHQLSSLRPNAQSTE